METSMRHHTNAKGDLAAGQGIAGLLRGGIQVCMPLSKHLPFDLVAVSPSMNDLWRGQVKGAAARRGTLRVTFRRTHADRYGIHNKGIQADEVDVFAIFCPDVDRVYYVRRDE